MVEYVGSWTSVAHDEPLPTNSHDQSCAVCADERPTWLHPLALDRVAFVVGRAEFTLPAFWALCDSCESAHRAGENALRARSDNAVGTADRTDLDHATLHAFRAADLGARPLPEADPQAP